ncbi:MAG TPA: HDOD domain-containing protein, partial [Rhodocyclaceae bacterium]|nr:HDOD domain-containing protein [Rhodocyclaceae bacterium]
MAINDAVMRLGITTVRRLAVTFSLVDQSLLGPCSAFDYPGFWSHSLFMAIASQELGRRLPLASPDELFTCGLLAQIGCLALATVYPADYAELLASTQGGCIPLDLERERLGLDHRQLAVAIMSDCGLPQALTEPL